MLLSSQHLISVPRSCAVRLVLVDLVVWLISEALLGLELLKMQRNLRSFGPTLNTLLWCGLYVSETNSAFINPSGCCMNFDRISLSVFPFCHLFNRFFSLGSLSRLSG